MIRFYPRDIGMWRTGEFDFTCRGDITLVCRTITDYKDFYDREDLIAFLKEHKVRLDDGEYPLTFELRYNDSWKCPMYVVKQWTVIGWMKEIL